MLNFYLVYGEVAFSVLVSKFQNSEEKESMSWIILGVDGAPEVSSVRHWPASFVNSIKIPTIMV